MYRIILAILLIFGFSTISTNAFAAWPNESVHYKFNDNAANTVIADSSGNGVNLGLVGANTADITTTGKISSALDFNGTSHYATVADNAVFNPASALSVSVWVYPDALEDGDLFVWQINEYGFSYGFSGGGVATGKVGFSRRSSGVFLGASDPGTLATGAWSCLQGKYDGANVSIRVNGGSWTNVPAIGDITSATNNLYTMGFSTASPYDVNGRIDDLRIYSTTVLTDAQFDAIYNSGNGTETSLVSLEPSGRNRVMVIS